MKKRSLALYLRDILDSIELLRKYTSSVVKDDLYKNDLLQDSLVRRLEIIGEATKHIPTRLRQKFPNIPWTDIVGARNIIIHEYYGVDVEKVWQTIQEDLPPLEKAVKSILAETTQQ